MWEPKPDQLLLIELAAKGEGVSQEAFMEMAILAVAEYKLRQQVEQLLQLLARLPRDMQGDVWNEVQTITLALGVQYYQGLKTLPALDEDH